LRHLTDIERIAIVGEKRWEKALGSLGKPFTFAKIRYYTTESYRHIFRNGDAPMALSPLAGQPAPPEMLVDLIDLQKQYEERKPDMSDPMQRVTFGTSGHRGTPLNGSFNDPHVAAIVQAICDYRKEVLKVEGPLMLGKDTHAISAPAERTAIEVLAANGVEVHIQEEDGYTPTPVISHAILGFNRSNQQLEADGIVITPSHNPPTDGGIKYNPPHGGPAEGSITSEIEDRANTILNDDNKAVKRMSYDQAIQEETTKIVDFADAYIRDLNNVVDMDAIVEASKRGELKLGANPLGGASVHYWKRIADHYGFQLDVVNPDVDKTFSFMTLDHDGKIRMDCSSPYAMKKMVDLKTKYDIAFGNDPDADRHGIVTRAGGLMNPNHYLAVAVQYLFTHRPDWPSTAMVGKSLVSSAMIDHVAQELGREIYEVPVGFKWFVPGLFDCTLGCGCEESAGASLLRRDGTTWSTDKDGIILNLLAAEIKAVTKEDPADLYKKLTDQYGESIYKRVEATASLEQRQTLGNLSTSDVKASTLAGEPILAKLVQALGNDAAIGGLKVITKSGWFAARPSGTEDIYKIYAESFDGQEHLDKLVQEAQEIVDGAFKGDP
jgi:phosphoglucomutase